VGLPVDIQIFYSFGKDSVHMWEDYSQRRPGQLQIEKVDCLR